MKDEINAKVRALLGEAETVSVDALADDSDLYDAGLTSFATVQLMLALEDTFNIEFPESLLNRRTFSSIGTITSRVQELLMQKVV
ncbi:MAG: acyl carrier protein [Hyphomicrobiaceae bacterium]|nr:acyl carrier protein [Hyphomicrobiaceae bacterium]